ncbi:MAG: hypothetical protein JSR99_09975 [Proteobacteria bacterium]|nr:hypothetical protein [Pseudomonadota bacterium]
MAKKPPRRKYKAGEIIAVLESCAGNKSLAASRLGCSRNTIDAYIARYPEICAALVEIRETFKDYAESQLKILVREKNPQAVFFTLRTVGRDRGYSERTEITGPGGLPIETKTVPAILTT